MRIRKDSVCLLVFFAMMAAGCATQAVPDEAQAAAAVSTQPPASAATATSRPATSIPPAETAAPTDTSAPPPAYNAGVNDYGYGLNDYGYGSATTPTTGQQASTAGQVKVGTATSSLGLILVDARGHTLYALTKDSPGVSTCQGSCLDAWPPLLADGAPIAGEGVQASLLGTMSRSDGGTQVTYDGKPLYSFADDQAAGDLKGQGKGGVWFAVTADGGYAR